MAGRASSGSTTALARATGNPPSGSAPTSECPSHCGSRPTDHGRAALWRRTVAAREAAAGGRRVPDQVDVRIAVVDGVRAVAVADLKVHRRPLAAVHQLMPVLDTRRKACAHAGTQHLFARAGAQHHFALEHINELILVRVPVPQRGFLAGRQRRVVDADAGESERIPEAALGTRQHARAVWLRVAAARDRLDTARIERRFMY